MNDPALDEKSIFLRAIEIASNTERSSYLAGACRDDGRLRGEVEALLEAHGRPSGLLDAADRPPGEECPGSTIGPFKLLEVVGEGGMGIVYVADQAYPVRRKVALKIIKPGMDTRQVLARFEVERQALAMMDHPNIAKVHDAGAAPSGRPYFVMELVKGIPITDFCDKSRLSIPDRLDLFVLVCRAVQHAHQKGIIHRDLKPSNILVTLIDGVAVPKVIDFGIAKNFGGTPTDATIYTGFLQLVGTPQYMSPEQAGLSGVDVDTRSDVYALGVLLYELLTGTTPINRATFGRAAHDEIRRAIREQDPPTPSNRLSTLGEALSSISADRQTDARKLGHALRGELDWIAMKALEKDRARRYESANDFAADVMRFLADRPVEACPPSSRYRLAKFARRNRLALTMAAVVVAALILAVVGLSASLLAISREQAKAQRRLALARQAADEMYTQVAEKWLAKQPLLTQVQRQFLEKALTFYEQFAAEAGADPQVRHDAVRALQRVGAIQEGLGEHDSAEKSWRQVVVRCTDLILQYPGRSEFRLCLAESRIDLAALLRNTGRPYRVDQEIRLSGTEGRTTFELPPGDIRAGAGEQEIRQAARELADLRIAFPASAESRRRLALAQAKLCGELTQARLLPEAEAAIKDSLELWKALVKDFPREIDHRFGLARAYFRLGTHLMWWGDREDKAEATLRQAESYLTALLSERPGDTGFRSTLASALSNRGVILGRAKRDAEGEVLFRRAASLCDGLVADFPDLLPYQEALADSLGNLASSAFSQSRYGEAEELHRRALDIREGLANRDREVPEHEARVGSSSLALSDTLAKQGKTADARQALERAVGRAHACLKIHPGHRGVDANLANSLRHLACLMFELGDDNSAVRTTEDWAHQYLNQIGRSDFGFDAAVAIEAQIQAANSTSSKTELSPMRRKAFAQFHLLAFDSLIKEAARLAPDDPKTLSLLADMLTTAPKELRNPELALEFADKALGLRPGDEMILQSVGWARYRSGDWAGCIEALEKQKGFSRDGDSFAAMARWQLGERDKARELFVRFDQWLAGYEKRWGHSTYPFPSMLRRDHAEAATLLGVKTAMGEPRSKPAPAAKGPAR